jgi:hypothetical protein
LLNPNFLPAGQELRRIHFLGLAASPDDATNPLTVDLLSSQKPYFTTVGGSSIFFKQPVAWRTLKS